MPKLNQVIAIEKGAKNRTNEFLIAFYRECQKPELFNGLSRNYRPRDEEGDRLPPEHTLVRVKGSERLQQVKNELAELMDITAARDWTNCTAKADVVVDGTVLIKQAPVTYLLWLEKQITDIQNDLRKLPVLDATEIWRWSDETGTYVTDPAETVKTKKIPRNHVKAEATEKFPAQVDVYTEDVIVGTWASVKQSGAFPQQSINEMLDRCQDVLRAIKFAREEANGTEVAGDTPRPGDPVLSFIYGN